MGGVTRLLALLALSALARATDCELSPWGAWAGCSVSCGCGVMYRSRRVLVPPSPGGAGCRELMGARSCNLRTCDGAAVSDARCDVHAPAPARPHPGPLTFFSSCHCNPAVDVATDVTCLLEHHTCHYRHDHPERARRPVVPVGGHLAPNNCDGRHHHSIRVRHIRPSVATPFHQKVHHVCKVVDEGPGAGAACRCCDCVRERTTAEGCPCGSRAHFFGKRWRYGASPYFFSFRPRPGTTRCEVLGEMTRGGLVEAEEGDMFVEGRLDFDGAGHLRFAGNWTEPSDGGCPAFSAARGVWDGLLRGARCGPIHFTVAGGQLVGSWWYDSFPDFPYTLKWGGCGAGAAGGCNASFGNALQRQPTGGICAYIDAAHVQMESLVRLLNETGFQDQTGRHLHRISRSDFEVSMLKAMGQLDQTQSTDLVAYFERLDLDKSGAIDRHDLEEALSVEHDYQDHLAHEDPLPAPEQGAAAAAGSAESCWEHNCTKRECPTCCSDAVARVPGQCDHCHAQFCSGHALAFPFNV